MPDTFFYVRKGKKMKKKTRISQCMIVKNEEKNIRRALSWAKPIAFEQIVVDTGSTDRTVEIAKEMGAKVYHFQWINDFAAAKNYAIEQASGDWIAFLDADEYMDPQDAKKLLKLLEPLSTPNPQKKVAMFVRCSWVQLDDHGKPFSVDVQDRIFRNRKDIRYHGKIHEQIRVPEDGNSVCIRAENLLTIFHTGYQHSVMQETNKSKRNIDLLQLELKKNPQDYQAWCYMGDAQKAADDLDRAADSYRKALEGKSIGKLSGERAFAARSGLMSILAEKSNKESSDEEFLRLAETYGYPNTDNPDPFFFFGLWHYNRQEMEQAREFFLTALAKLEAYQGKEKIVTGGYLRMTYVWLAQACLCLKRAQEMVHYCVLALRMDRFQDKVLTAVLKLLKQEPGENEQAAGTWRFLQGLYDFQSNPDLLFLYKCATAAGFRALRNQTLEAMPPELKAEILKRTEKKASMKEDAEIPIYNRTDQWFLSWVRKIRKHSEAELVESMKQYLENLKMQNRKSYDTYVDYYRKYPLWGALNPENGDFDTLIRRAHTVKTHLEDLIWLYKSLSDYRSKMTLLAVLFNWTDFNLSLLNDIREKGMQYYDPDLIPSGKDEIFVDVGAYTGDSILNFIGMYGKNYRKIYAYEPDRKNAEKLKQNTLEYSNIDIRRKGAGKAQGTWMVQQGSDPSANSLIQTDDSSADTVQIVALDADLTEPVTWIKMDIEGAEEDALLGCETIIRSHSPKLSICTYHGYEDIWKLPRLIDRMNPSYRFYMRYYGGNLIPTEFVLTALPPESKNSGKESSSHDGI